MRDLCWAALVVVAVVGGARGYDQPSCDGRQTIVHLFEWKWADIAAECERFLGPAGFCGVQVSPPMEHIVSAGDGYPWWQRYQPVSYKLESRSGNEEQFTDMVQRCNAVGVRIIVDAVVNHMTGLGRVGPGSGGTDFNADNLDFPGVPFSSMDFTPKDQCPSSNGMINNYNDPNEVRNCYLVGLTDLYGAKDYVREKIAEYFNHLIDIGVMGFRVDAAKHMWPGDLEAIQGLTKDLSTAAGFPSGRRPFFFHEVIDQGGEPITVQEYFGVGRTTEFRFGKKIAWGINSFDQLGGVYDPGWGMAPSEKAVVFVDNHDNQRGHGGAGDILTHKQPKEYTMGVCFSLAHDYGFMRIMSSYYFDNSDQGPPGSSYGGTDDVPINGDGTCGGGWVCEHRWNAITQMVKFRNAVAGTQIANWFQEGDNVAFSRGDKGFFAMSKYGSFDRTLQTGMPAGTYCELISGCVGRESGFWTRSRRLASQRSQNISRECRKSSPLSARRLCLPRLATALPNTHHALIRRKIEAKAKREGESAVDEGCSTNGGGERRALIGRRRRRGGGAGQSAGATQAAGGAEEYGRRGEHSALRRRSDTAPARCIGRSELFEFTLE